MSNVIRVEGIQAREAIPTMIKAQKPHAIQQLSRPEFPLTNVRLYSRQNSIETTMPAYKKSIMCVGKNACEVLHAVFT